MKVILLGDTNTDNTSIVLIGKDCKVIISEGCSIGGGKLVCMGNSNFIHIVPNCGQQTLILFIVMILQFQLTNLNQ